MTTDTHAQARAYAQARLDDRLAPEHQAWLAAHLAGCAGCRRYADELSSLERLLPETFQARWDSLRPAARSPHKAGRPSNPSAYVPIGGPTMARQKLFNYAGITLGLGALAVLLIGFAFALQTATTTDSLIPGQAGESTGLPAMFTPPPMQFATTVAFGDAIALEGYNLIPSGDGVVTVELLWHALAAPPADYMVGLFVMPDGAQSAIFAQSDTVPAMGTRPTSGWQPGEYIVDSHDLTVASDADLDAAPLVFWVNVYDPQTGERLPSDPPGNGPFSATAIGMLHVPAEAPLTATPLPFSTGGTPDPCVSGGPCTPTPTPGPTYTPCAEGFFGCPASEGPTYLVQVGDTLQSIASLYGLTVEEIMAANGLTEPNIAVGQELYIPLQPLTTPHCARAADCAAATAAWAATLGWTPTPTPTPAP